MADETNIPNAPLGSVPKRKPLPYATVAPDTEAAADQPDQAPTPQNPTDEKPSPKAPFFGPVLAWWALQKRSRKALYIGLVVALLLIALIIGLAVGLTVGKKNSKSNLALPTTNGGPYTGDLTYYDPGLGACGYTNTESDLICAVSHILFDAASTGSDPNDNPLCGLKIRIRRDGESVDVKVVDRCVGCAETDLDVTETVFGDLATIAQGRVTMEWAWLETAPVSA
ncbi:uncharacterized protein N7483_003717 [Penicillium malachiteum]|uniref:uncharacterized protein n=1 Tax=Penicillium malachiteum TaxID=1324776 RepID=UPI002546683E|nr:uncharacterized protein N7483_003717 [Penicillium malachiteum]KAJ5729209.1 hypothetical protein N7483_003717 [Penicillium malachiteum]